MKTKQTTTLPVRNSISRSPVTRRFLLIPLASLAFICLALSPTAHAQTTVVDFVVVSGTPITSAGNVDAGDILIFTGTAKFVTPAGTCGPPGNYPVQNAVVVDHAGGRATRVIDAIVVANSDATQPPPPVKPGTKLVNLQTLPSCQDTAAVIGYDRYRGTVQ